MIPIKYQNSKYEDIPKEIRVMFEKITKTRKGIYIHGDVGTGKTHIAYALKRQWDVKASKLSLFWNTNDLMNVLRKDFDRQYADKIRSEEHIIGKTNLLFLDDIGSEKMTEFVAETFYRIINDRYENMVPIIFTSNLPISDLAERVGDRTASRIVESCVVVELKGTDRRMEKSEKIKVSLES